MIKQIEIVKKVRALLLDGIKDLTVEQLNKMPIGRGNIDFKRIFEYQKTCRDATFLCWARHAQKCFCKYCKQL